MQVSEYLIQKYDFFRIGSSFERLNDSMKVFLSHSTRDKPLVREVLSHLPSHVIAWIDEKNLLIGDNIEDSIQSTINSKSDFVILFIGSESIKSDWVKKELNWALEQEKICDRIIIIPVLLDQDVWKNVEPKTFQNRKYLECYDFTKDGIKHFSEILKDQLFAILSRRLDSDGIKQEVKNVTVNQSQSLKTHDTNNSKLSRVTLSIIPISILFILIIYAHNLYTNQPTPENWISYEKWRDEISSAAKLVKSLEENEYFVNNLLYKFWEPDSDRTKPNKIHIASLLIHIQNQFLKFQRITIDATMSPEIYLPAQPTSKKGDYMAYYFEKNKAGGLVGKRILKSKWEKNIYTPVECFIITKNKTTYSEGDYFYIDLPKYLSQSFNSDSLKSIIDIYFISDKLPYSQSLWQVKYRCSPPPSIPLNFCNIDYDGTYNNEKLDSTFYDWFRNFDAILDSTTNQQHDIDSTGIEFIKSVKNTFSEKDSVDSSFVSLFENFSMKRKVKEKIFIHLEDQNQKDQVNLKNGLILIYSWN